MSVQFGTVVAVSSAGASTIVDDLDPVSQMPVDVWTPIGTGIIGDRVIYDVVAGQVVVYGNVTGPGRWTFYNPVIKNDVSGLSVSTTINDARYLVIGKTCFAQGWATANVACNSAGITLPFTSKARVLNCGTCGIFGTSPPTGQSGIAYMTTDKAKVVSVSFAQGFSDMLAGHAIRWNISYEIA